jgi:hypothetical protein
LGKGKAIGEADWWNFYPKKIGVSFLADSAPVDSSLFLLPYLPKDSKVFWTF